MVHAQSTRNEVEYSKEIMSSTINARSVGRSVGRWVQGPPSPAPPPPLLLALFLASWLGFFVHSFVCSYHSFSSNSSFARSLTPSFVLYFVRSIVPFSQQHPMLGRICAKGACPRVRLLPSSHHQKQQQHYS